MNLSDLDRTLFEAPGWFALIALLPLMLALRARRRLPALFFAPFALLAARLSGTAPEAEERRRTPVPVLELPEVPGSWRTRTLLVPPSLTMLGLLLAITAAARPSVREPLPPTSMGRDILLVVDRSSSMTAKDLDPERSRLEVAREAARAFVERRPHDRIGLVAFARYPDLLCPPTLDHEAVAAFFAELTPVDPETAEDATGIGTALALAGRTLRRSEAAARVVVLLTDGQETVATSRLPGEIAPTHAAQLLEGLGVRAHAIAIGRHDRGAPGQALDTADLRTLASRTKGRFFAAPDAATLAGIYAEIDALESAPLPEIRYRQRSLAPPLLALAAVLLAAAWGLSTTIWRVLP